LSSALASRSHWAAPAMLGGLRSLIAAARFWAAISAIFFGAGFAVFFSSAPLSPIVAMIHSSFRRRPFSSTITGLQAKK
jgi:hypothetical protein